MGEGRSEMLFCGIDIARHSDAVLVVDDANRVVQPAFSTENRRQSFEHLITLLAVFSDLVAIGMQAMVRYWLVLYDHLTHGG
jgi:hypothetical protein